MHMQSPGPLQTIVLALCMLWHMPCTHLECAGSCCCTMGMCINMGQGQYYQSTTDTLIWLQNYCTTFKSIHKISYRRLIAVDMAGSREAKSQKRRARLFKLARTRALEEVVGSSCDRYSGSTNLYVAIAYQKTYLGIALSMPSMCA